jgi:hypothetical protein
MATSIGSASPVGSVEAARLLTKNRAPRRLPQRLGDDLDPFADAVRDQVLAQNTQHAAVRLEHDHPAARPGSPGLVDSHEAEVRSAFEDHSTRGDCLCQQSNEGALTSELTKLPDVVELGEVRSSELDAVHIEHEALERAGGDRRHPVDDRP